MIKLQGKLPRQIWLACSGGVDSMAALDFLRRNHQVNVLHFDHGTEHGRQARQFLERYCTEKQIPLTVGESKGTVPPGPISREEWWREQRYAFLDKFFEVLAIVLQLLFQSFTIGNILTTCHNRAGFPRSIFNNSRH